MKKILAIDDKKNNLFAIKEMINNLIPDCEVLTAQSGRDGIEIAKTKQPDTILLDIVMPEMDGYEVCEILKNDKLTKHIPIIMLTAIKTDTESKIKGLEAGADAFFSLPIGPVELSAQVNVMLRIKEAEDKLRLEKSTLKKEVLERTKKLNAVNKKLLLEITERKRVEETVYESEERLNDVAFSMADWIWEVDERGNYIYCSKKGQDIMGYSTEEIIGKTPFDFMRPDEARKIGKMFSEIVANKEPIKDLENWNIRKDGEEICLLTNGVPILDKEGNLKGYRGVDKDITKRKLAEDALRKSGDQYRSLFNQIADPVVVFDQKTKMIIDCNTAMINKYGYTADELYKMTPIDLHPSGEDTERVKRNIDDKEKILPNEYLHKGKDGTIYNVETHTKEVFYKGKEAWISIIRDITERKQAEKELQQFAKQLQERNKELDAFSHTVAHDLKNPLGTIMGFAEFLFEGYSKFSNDEILNYLNLIIEDCKKSQQIINSLLLFANVRKSEISTEELTMGNIVNETIKRLTPMIKKSNAKITLPDVWPIAIGYTTWIEEVWVNYLSNAIKYGGNPPVIKIGADICKTEIVPEGMVRFWIHDNGRCISEENQKLLFNTFERLNQVKTEGHGLGLSIVQRIIEKLGGEVGLESNKGNLFYFTLPYSGKTYENTMVINEVSDSKKDNKLGRLKVLIVEDIESADLLLSIVLRKISKEILHAKTGKEAVDLYRDNPDIDLILMDIRMPEMNGYEATQKIRKLNKNVIIIAQTAYALKGDREKSLKAGCDDYITKPVKKDSLLKMIAKYFTAR